MKQWQFILNFKKTHQQQLRRANINMAQIYSFLHVNRNNMNSLVIFSYRRVSNMMALFLLRFYTRSCLFKAVAIVVASNLPFPVTFMAMEWILFMNVLTSKYWTTKNAQNKRLNIFTIKLVIFWRSSLSFQTMSTS